MNTEFPGFPSERLPDRKRFQKKRRPFFWKQDDSFWSILKEPEKNLIFRFPFREQNFRKKYGKSFAGFLMARREATERLPQKSAVRAEAAQSGWRTEGIPAAILVPCHRVIGADGSLTGYAGKNKALHIKAFLLELEGALPDRKRAAELSGGKENDGRFTGKTSGAC